MTVQPFHNWRPAKIHASGRNFWRHWPRIASRTANRAAGPAWHTMTAGLLFALMIAWSGHNNVLIGLAVLLLAVMLARAITGHLRPHAGPVSPPPARKLKVS
jgi:hypothetical protein